MENKYLKKVQKHLKGYFSYFKHNDILVISEDKSVMPFAYIMSDEVNYPGILLLSLAIDFPFSEKAVDLALKANRVLPVAISDKFFVSQMGTTYIGDDADKYYEIETQLPLQEIDPASPNVH